MLEGDEKDEAIESGIIILSGGRDVSGNFLLTIPTSRLDDILQWETTKLATLFVLIADIAKCFRVAKSSSMASFHALPLAFIADLRNASTGVITLIVESLETVEHHSRGTISTVYFLSPKKKNKSHTLKKLLGLKPSKKRPRVPLFKIVLVKTVQELHTQIDVSHLTLDFCGTLMYNHLAWMHFYNVVIKCIEGCQTLLSQLGGVKDKVDLLQEYETEGLTTVQLQQLLADLQDKYHMIISESSLPLYQVQSKQTLFLLEHPTSDTHISAIHPHLITEFRSCLKDLFTELDRWSNDLEDSWKVTEGRLTILIQVQKHRERAKEIERKICEHYHPLLHEHPIVGKTLSQAELYRAHFTTTLYEPAKELLSQATEILEAVQKLKNGTSLPVGHYTTFFGGLDLSDITSCLTTSIQPFTLQLQHLQQLYVDIHIFHLLFEKTLIWYKKVLKFIPDTLLDKCTTESDLSSIDLSYYNLSPQGRESLVYMPAEWLGAVRVFLSRHPPPRQEHIDRLDETLPQLVDRKLRAQARSLALRLRLIHRVLSRTRLPLQLINAILSWKTELFGPRLDRSVGHHAHATSKQKTKPGMLEDDLDSSSDKSQPLKRALDKSGKRKSLDLEAAVRQTDLALTFPERNLEKFLQKRTTSRPMFRAKSVEFNFNSSSTDGSVFDYERAVSGLHHQQGAGTGKDMVRARAYPRRARKESQDTGFRAATVLGGVTKDDVALSDPSDMLKRPPKTKDFPGKAPEREYKTDASTEDLSTFNSRSETLPEPEPSSSSSLSTMSGNQTLPGHAPKIKVEGKLGPLAPDINTPDERFIRLTLTPKDKISHPLQVFQFESLESDNGTVPAVEDEELSTEVAEGAEDPYDDLVHRIREVSASSLSNTEKLKKVSQILSMSTARKSPEDKMEEDPGRRLGRFSMSTVDLRQGEHWHSHQDRMLKSAESPVSAVLRMKRNLARSMEELNCIDEPATPAVVSDRRGQHSQAELKSYPAYNFGEKLKHDQREPEEPYSKTLTPFTPEDQREDQSWSDLESVSPVSSSASTGQAKTTKTPEYQSKFSDSFSAKGSGHRTPDFRQDSEQRLNSTRPGFSYLTNRNFLSPSFLRPAVSMKDLRHQPAATGFDPDFFKETDYRALKEMEMMRSLQEDPLSNQFFKFSPDKRKQSRIFSGDQERLKFGAAVSEMGHELKSESDTVEESSDRAIPDIHVDYIYFVEHMDSQPVDGNHKLESERFARLVTETEHEHLSQEEVAHSLRKTQRILEEEEMKLRHLECHLSDGSLEESSADGIHPGAHSLSHTASTDNGYGSWAGKLATALSTSSDGPDLDSDFFSGQDHQRGDHPDLY